MSGQNLTELLYAGAYTEWTVGSFLLFCLFLWTAFTAKDHSARRFAAGLACIEFGAFARGLYWLIAQTAVLQGWTDPLWWHDHRWFIVAFAQAALIGGIMVTGSALRKIFGRYWLAAPIGIAVAAFLLGMILQS